MPGKTVRFSEDVVFPPTPSPTFSNTSLPSSYGPLTPPNAFNHYAQLNAGGEQGTIHPVLEFRGPAAPYLCFDVTLPQQNVTPSTKMSSDVLMNPATKEGLSTLILVHPRLGAWHITVRPAEGKVVLVRDVLSAIYTSLRQPATGADFDSLPPPVQREVGAAFARRWARMPPQMQNAERAKGLKRVDFLGSGVTFAGLSKSQMAGCWNLLLA
jgi:hypothetical protein